MGRAPGRGAGKGAVFRQKEFSENEKLEIVVGFITYIHKMKMAP